MERNGKYKTCSSWRDKPEKTVDLSVSKIGTVV
jgi:hypothetical protein